jgi:transcriptional regulator GlxA family with amidase domain
VSQLKDDLFSYKIARELVVYMRRKGNESQQSVFLQYRNHIHVGVHRVQDWLQEHINQKTNLEELAEIACMSSRNLTRVFKRETSLSIHDFITLLRKEKINELLKNPDLTRLQIAQKVGLQSERQLMRLIK